MCAMTHSYMWHDSNDIGWSNDTSSTCATRRIYTMNHVYDTSHLCRTYEWIMSHPCHTESCMRHVSSVCATRLVQWIMCVRRVSSMCAIWHINMCDRTHSHMCHDAFAIGIWYARHDSSMCATWRIHMCDMALSYVRHDPSICATCLIYMCSMTHPYVQHGSFICVTWLIQICDMPLFHLCDRTHPHRIWLIVQKDSSWPGAPLRAASDLYVIFFCFWHAHTHTLT